MLLRITSNYFCASLVYENGAITRIAPILKYMKDWNLESIEEYCSKKGWDYEYIV